MNKQQIFVFGSNKEGKHLAGAALYARTEHGAIYGQGEGLQNNSYAIITKELRSDHPKTTLFDIEKGVFKFLDFTKQHPEMDFNVTPIGCGLAGFTPKEIAPLFYRSPSNVKLPTEFIEILQTTKDDDPVIAILTSDWHLWYRPPVFRSAESDWLAYQANYIKQIFDLLPPPPTQAIIIHAGDLFDRPDPPSSFLSWCIDNVPEMYIVPGQHDLPSHRLQDLDKSALGALIKIHRCHLLHATKPTPIYESNLVLHGFSWGQEVRPFYREPGDEFLHIATIHAYIWTKKTGYQGAPEEQRLHQWDERLKGYDGCVFGDNHKGFMVSKNTPCTILNNGTFMIRKADERNHKPTVGLLHQSGKITRHYLDCSKDKYLNMSDLQSTIINMGCEIDTTEFIKELESLGDQGLDFVESIKRWCIKNKVEKEVQELLLEFMEGNKK